MANGLVVIFNDLPAIIQAMREGAKVGVRQVAQEITKESSESAPYAEGVLAASAYYVASDVSTYSQAVAAATAIDDREMLPEVAPPDKDTEAYVAYAASYAIFQHDGTRFMAGRPWLAQTAEGSRDRVVQKVADAINKAIGQVAPPAVP